MNRTDSLKVWASLHKNAGNHLHSQEDPLSKKEKIPMPQLKTTLIFQCYVVSFAAALPRAMGARSIAKPAWAAAKETKRYVDRQSQ